MALTSSIFILVSNFFKYLLIVIPIVGGCLISISLRELLLYMFLFAMAIITWHQSKDSTMFQVICLAFGLRKIDFRRVVLVFFSGLGLGTAFILIGSLVGEFTSVVTMSGEESAIKTSLGFMLPNTAGLILFNLLLMLVYLIMERSRNQKGLFLCTLPIAYLVYKTGARTSFFLVILLYIIWGCLSNQKISKAVLRHMSEIVIGITAFVIVFSYVTSANYSDSGWMSQLNNLTTNRLAFGSQAVSNYGLTFFGQTIPYNAISLEEIWWNRSSYFWIDNAYIKLLVNEGVFWIGVLLYGIYIMTKKAKSAGNVALVIPVILMVLLGYSESSFLYSWFDFVLFAAGANFSMKKNIELSVLSK